MGTGWGQPCDGLASHPVEVEILLVASCYRHRDKLWPDEPLGAYVDFATGHESVSHKSCSPQLPGLKIL